MGTEITISPVFSILSPFHMSWICLLLFLVLPSLEGGALQSQYTVLIPSRDESCFYLEEVDKDWVISIWYVVVTVGKGGSQHDITVRVNSPENKLVEVQGRRQAGHVRDLRTTVSGNYQICFNNQYSVVEGKLVRWGVEMEGQVVNEDIKGAEEYLKQAEEVDVSLKEVKMALVKTRSMGWIAGSQLTKDLARMKSISSLIDWWSGTHLLIVVIVGVLQILAVRRLFAEKSKTRNLKLST